MAVPSGDSNDVPMIEVGVVMPMGTGICEMLGQ